MIPKTLTACAATAALIIAGPALAGPGGHGGGHGANGGGVGASANVGMHGNGNGADNAGANVGTGGMMTNPAVGVSQGPANASITGIEHANSHSVLASGAVPGSSLTGLAPGVSILNTSGTSIGTVSQVVTDSNGNIRLVLVTSPTGQTFRLMPNTLTLNNGVFTTSSTIGG